MLAGLKNRKAIAAGRKIRAIGKRVNKLLEGEVSSAQVRDASKQAIINQQKETANQMADIRRATASAKPASAAGPRLFAVAIQAGTPENTSRSRNNN